MRFLPKIIVLSLLFVTPLEALAKGYTDLPTASPTAKALGRMTDAGFPYFDGFYSSPMLQPDAPVSRGEFVLIALRTSLRGEGESNTTKSDCFSDVGEKEVHWRPICAAKMSSLIQGYPDGLFRPKQNINLAEAVKITTLAFDLSPDTLSSANTWYEPFMKTAATKGAFASLSRDPAHPMNRQDAILLIEAIFPK